MDVLRHRNRWLLLAILGIALYVRLATVGFGLPALNDPDELMFEMGALRMLRGPTLDPGWFGHPATTTMYVLALIDAAVFALALLTGRAASPRAFGEMVYADPGIIVLPGRIAMVLFALGTIWLTWRLAARFFGPRAGLAAAALLAIDPVHVTWSQIIRSDMMACFFMLLCLQSAADIAERGRWRDYLLAALWLGLAIATKWPFALTALAIGAATLLAVREGVLSSGRGLMRLAGSGLTAIGFLFLASPYLLIDYPTVIRNLAGEGQARHLGATGGSPWDNLLWYLDGPLMAGFGMAGLALIVVGAFRLARHRRALAILAPVAIGFMLLFCLQRLVWERWALPLMPIGAMVAAFGMVELADPIRRYASRRAEGWALAAMLLAVLAPLAWRAREDGIARMNDTRQLATAWAIRHIPSGSTVLVEHFGFDMLGHGWRLFFPIGDAGCVDVLALLHGQKTYAAIERSRGQRSNLDYGTMAATARAICRPDYAVLTQFDRYRQERGRFPEEYAAYGTLLAKGSVAATFMPEPGVAGGPVVRMVKR